MLPITGTGVVASGRCRGAVHTNAFTAINSTGAAVGESTVAVVTGTATTFVQHAVVYSGGTQKDLGVLGGAAASSTATGINASGLIVGGSTLSTKRLHPFSYAGGAITDLGLPAGYSDASATAIASDGTIVGVGTAGRLVKSFVLRGGAFADLGSLYAGKRSKKAQPLQAAGVNADGVVVGNTLDAAGKPRAFVYAGATLYDLSGALPTGYAGWTVVSAGAVTDSEYVSAIGVDAAGKQHGLLLKLSGDAL